MREVKFKYINVKPRIVISEIFTLREIELGKAQQWCEMNLVHKDTLYKLQFTGLLDKNGKEIYEGDIIRYYHYRGKIEKTWGSFGFQAERDRFETLHNICDAGSIHKVEITGNIHENPELLS